MSVCQLSMKIILIKTKVEKVFIVVVFLCRNLRNNNLRHSVAGIELIKLPPRIQG